jgi:hypothetical protein
LPGILSILRGTLKSARQEESGVGMKARGVLARSARGLIILLALIVPFDTLSATLVLALASEGILCVLIVRTLGQRRPRTASAAAPSTPEASIATLAGGESSVVWLQRRMVPQLRRHRPYEIVELQVRWRAAAEAAAARRRGQA